MIEIKGNLFNLVLLLLLVFSELSYGEVSQEFVKEINAKADVVKIAKDYESEFGNRYGDMAYELYSQFNHPEGEVRPVVLEFPDGNRYLIENALGKGHISYVFKAKNLRTNNSSALRIPQNYGRVLFFDQYSSEHKYFKETNFNLPKLYDSMPGLYAESELLTIDFTLGDLFEKPHQIKKKLVDEAIENLEELAKAFREMSAFGDNKPHNIGYDSTKKKWIVVDWTTPPKKFDELKRVEDFSRLLEQRSIINNSREHYHQSRIQDNIRISSRGLDPPEIVDVRNKIHEQIYKNLELGTHPVDAIDVSKMYRQMPIHLRSANLPKQLDYISSIDKSARSELIKEALLKVRSWKELSEVLNLSGPIDIGGSKMISQLKTYLESPQSFKGSEEIIPLKEFVEHIHGKVHFSVGQEQVARYLTNEAKDHEQFFSGLDRFGNDYEKEVIRMNWKELLDNKKLNPDIESKSMFLEKLVKDGLLDSRQEEVESLLTTFKEGAERARKVKCLMGRLNELKPKR